MDRRIFLETVIARTTVPALASRNASSPSTQTGGEPANLASSPRIRQNLNANWRFMRQSKATGRLGSFDRENGVAAEVEPRFREAYKMEYDDSGWQAIDLPHTWNAHDTNGPNPGYWRGIGWYRKRFKLDAASKEKRVFLEFDEANSVAECWLNGERIGEHKSGYTSFEFDVTRQARFGAEDNVLTVKVNNLFDATVPPTVKTELPRIANHIDEPVCSGDLCLRAVQISELFEPQVNARAIEPHLDELGLRTTSFRCPPGKRSKL